MTRLTAGFVGFGEVNSPRELIVKKCLEAKKVLEDAGVDLISTEPVSDDPEGKDVQRAISELYDKSFDFLVVCIAGWIPSHAVIHITEKFKYIPMVLWGLCGHKIENRIVTTADQAGTTALRKVFNDLGYQFKFVYNVIDKPVAVEKIISFGLAARAMKQLNGSKVGMMGFRDMQLYGTLYEGISLKAKFGVDVLFFEMLEMVQLAEKIKAAEIKPLKDKILADWEFQNLVPDETLEKGIKFYLALKNIIERKKIQAISMNDVDGMKLLLKYPPAFIFMLLTDELKVCAVPENDTLGAVTQLIVKSITGQAAAYLEYYEFFENSVLLGVPDFVPGEIVDGKITLRVTNFGSFSGGVLNVSKLKTGTVTLVRLTYKGENYAMHIVTGKAVTPASWEEAGWDQPAPQLPGLQVILNEPMEVFSEKVLSQHYIIAYGDYSNALKDFCKLKNIEIM